MTLTFFDQAAWDLQAAWSAWAAESCIERHGNHLRYLKLLHPEEDCRISLGCDYCGTSGHEQFSDFAEWPEGDIDGVELTDVMGTVTHNGRRAGRVRVHAEMWPHRYWTPNGDEWDAGLTITQLEPVEWEEE